MRQIVPMTTPRALPRQHYDWLQGELTAWTAEGLVTPDAATTLRDRYTSSEPAGARSVLAKVLLSVGGAFLGVGLIWLVAANLDHISPLLRFVGVAVVWLTFLLVPEVLAARQHSRALVGALRLVGAMAFGAMVFQAAQSLQVPAYAPHLVGVWALGTFAHAYVVRGVTPLVVALATGSIWWFWAPLSHDTTAVGWVVLIVLGSVTATGVAAVHDRRLPTFAALWRVVAVGYVLVALFAAAFPWTDFDGWGTTTWTWVVGAITLVCAVAGLALGDRLGRLEVAGALLLACLAVVMLVWDPPADVSDVSTAAWLHSVLGVGTYVLAAVALTALGTLRGNRWISGLATAGLVVFVTFQSFAVFGQIVTGAWLFLVLGAVLLATGFLFDRARRSIRDQLTEDRPDFLEGTDR